METAGEVLSKLLKARSQTTTKKATANVASPPTAAQAMAAAMARPQIGPQQQRSYQPIVAPNAADVMVRLTGGYNPTPAPTPLSPMDIMRNIGAAFEEKQRQVKNQLVADVRQRLTQSTYNPAPEDALYVGAQRLIEPYITEWQQAYKPIGEHWAAQRQALEEKVYGKPYDEAFVIPGIKPTPYKDPIGKAVGGVEQVLSAAGEGQYQDPLGKAGQTVAGLARMAGEAWGQGEENKTIGDMMRAVHVQGGKAMSYMNQFLEGVVGTAVGTAYGLNDALSEPPTKRQSLEAIFRNPWLVPEGMTTAEAVQALTVPGRNIYENEYGVTVAEDGTAFGQSMPFYVSNFSPTQRLALEMLAGIYIDPLTMIGMGKGAAQAGRLRRVAATYFPSMQDAVGATSVIDNVYLKLADANLGKIPVLGWTFRHTPTAEAYISGGDAIVYAGNIAGQTASAHPDELIEGLARLVNDPDGMTGGASAARKLSELFQGADFTELPSIQEARVAIEAGEEGAVNIPQFISEVSDLAFKKRGDAIGLFDEAGNIIEQVPDKFVRWMKQIESAFLLGTPRYAIRNYANNTLTTFIDGILPGAGYTDAMNLWRNNPEIVTNAETFGAAFDQAPQGASAFQVWVGGGGRLDDIFFWAKPIKKVAREGRIGENIHIGENVIRPVTQAGWFRNLWDDMWTRNSRMAGGTGMRPVITPDIGGPFSPIVNDIIAGGPLDSKVVRERVSNVLSGSHRVPFSSVVSPGTAFDEVTYEALRKSWDEAGSLDEFMQAVDRTETALKARRADAASRHPDMIFKPGDSTPPIGEQMASTIVESEPRTMQVAEEIAQAQSDIRVRAQDHVTAAIQPEDMIGDAGERAAMAIHHMNRTVNELYQTGYNLYSRAHNELMQNIEQLATTPGLSDRLIKAGVQKLWDKFFEETRPMWRNVLANQDQAVASMIRSFDDMNAGLISVDDYNRALNIGTLDPEKDAVLQALEAGDEWAVAMQANREASNFTRNNAMQLAMGYTARTGDDTVMRWIPDIVENQTIITDATQSELAWKRSLFSQLPEWPEIRAATYARQEKDIQALWKTFESTIMKANQTGVLEPPNFNRAFNVSHALDTMSLHDQIVKMANLAGIPTTDEMGNVANYSRLLNHINKAFIDEGIPPIPDEVLHAPEGKRVTTWMRYLEDIDDEHAEVALRSLQPEGERIFQTSPELKQPTMPTAAPEPAPAPLGAEFPTPELEQSFDMWKRTTDDINRFGFSTDAVETEMRNIVEADPEVIGRADWNSLRDQAVRNLREGQTAATKATIEEMAQDTQTIVTDIGDDWYQAVTPDGEVFTGDADMLMRFFDGLRKAEPRMPQGMNLSDISKRMANLFGDARPSGMDAMRLHSNMVLGQLDDLRNTAARMWDRSLMPGSPELQQRVMRWIDDVYIPQQAAAKSIIGKMAEAETNFSLLDYNSQRNFDRILNLFFPYQYWTTRSGWNWMRRFAYHPFAISAYAKRKQMLAAERQSDNGLRPRFWNSMKAQFPWLPDWMEQALYVDLDRMIIPFSDLNATNWSDVDQANTIWDKAMTVAGSVGLAPHVPYQMAGDIISGKGLGGAADYIPQWKFMRSLLPYNQWTFGPGLGGSKFDLYRIQRQLASMGADLMRIENLDYSDVAQVWEVAQRLGKRDFKNLLPYADVQATVERWAMGELSREELDALFRNPIFQEALKRQNLESGIADVSSFLTGLRLTPVALGEKQQVSLQAAEHSVGYRGELLGPEGNRANIQTVREAFPEGQLRWSQYGVLPGEEQPSAQENYRRMGLNVGLDEVDGKYKPMLAQMVIDDPSNFVARERIMDDYFAARGEIFDEWLSTREKNPSLWSTFGATSQEVLQIRREQVIAELVKTRPRRDDFAFEDATISAGPYGEEIGNEEIDWEAYNLAMDAWYENLPQFAKDVPMVRVAAADFGGVDDLGRTMQPFMGDEARMRALTTPLEPGGKAILNKDDVRAYIEEELQLIDPYLGLSKVLEDEYYKPWRERDEEAVKRFGEDILEKYDTYIGAAEKMFGDGIWDELNAYNNELDAAFPEKDGQSIYDRQDAYYKEIDALEARIGGDIKKRSDHWKSLKDAGNDSAATAYIKNNLDLIKYWEGKDKILKDYPDVLAYWNWKTDARARHPGVEAYMAGKDQLAEQLGVSKYKDEKTGIAELFPDFMGGKATDFVDKVLATYPWFRDNGWDEEYLMNVYAQIADIPDADMIRLINQAEKDNRPLEDALQELAIEEAVAQFEADQAAEEGKQALADAEKELDSKKKSSKKRSYYRRSRYSSSYYRRSYGGYSGGGGGVKVFRPYLPGYSPGATANRRRVYIP